MALTDCERRFVRQAMDTDDPNEQMRLYREARCKGGDNTDARGCIYVSYEREAYVSTESNSIRVTFDRQLIGSPYQHGDHLSMPHHGASPPIGNGEKVILELKFTDRFPIWMRELVQAFNLQRTSAPKYVNCIDAMRVQPGHWHITGTGIM